MDNPPQANSRKIFIRRKLAVNEVSAVQEPALQNYTSERPKAAPPAGSRRSITPTHGNGDTRRTSNFDKFSVDKPAGHATDSLFPSQEDVSRLSRDYLAARQKRLQSLTLEGRLMANRDTRVIDRHEAVTQHWERFRQLASKMTNRGVGELAITRAEEHRERNELFELIDAVTPVAEKSGEDLWYHTLRNGGVKFIQVGNMFSGLYVPLKLTRAHLLNEIVRKPWLKDCFNHREGKYHKTWRDDQYLKDRLTRFRVPMRNAAAGVIGFDDTLEIVGRRQGMGTSCDGNVYGQERDQPTATGESAPEVCEKRISAHTGPSVSVSTSHIYFSVYTIGSPPTLKELKITNDGSTVIDFEFGPVQQIETIGSRESPFRSHQCTGRLLPGDSKILYISFDSPVTGYFQDLWFIKTIPVTEKIIITFEGMAAVDPELTKSEVDSEFSELYFSQVTAAQKAIHAMDDEVARSSILRDMREIVYDIVDLV